MMLRKVNHMSSPIRTTHVSLPSTATSALYQITCNRCSAEQVIAGHDDAYTEAEFHVMADHEGMCEVTVELLLPEAPRGKRMVSRITH